MQPSHSHLIASVLAMALLTPGAAWAQAVSLAGILGSKALLVVDGSPPRGVAAGETHQGVKVVSVGRDEAMIEIKGARSTVRLGEAPVSIGARTGTGRKVVLMSDSIPCTLSKQKGITTPSISPASTRLPDSGGAGYCCSSACNCTSAGSAVA